MQLKSYLHIFAAVFASKGYPFKNIFNVQPRIGMNKSLSWLRYNTTLLMTSHGYISIQHLSAQSVEAFWLFLCLNCGVYNTISVTEFIDFFQIKSNWKLQYFENKRQIWTSIYSSFFETSL